MLMAATSFGAFTLSALDMEADPVDSLRIIRHCSGKHVVRMQPARLSPDQQREQIDAALELMATRALIDEIEAQLDTQQAASAETLPLFN